MAFLTHSAARSGAELFVLRVTRAARTLRPLVVLGEEGPLVDDLSEAGVRTIVAPLAAGVGSHAADSRPGPLVLARHALGVVRGAEDLARVLRDEGASVVTTHSAKAHVYGGLAARRAGLPHVAHLHDHVGGPHVSRLNAAVLRTALRTLPSGIVANSRTTLDSLGATTRPATIVGCPVALPATVPAPAAPGSTAPALLMLGRLTPWKGQDVVVRALARARERGLDGRVGLRLVGAPLFGDDDRYVTALHDLVAELGLDDVVEFAGHRQDVDAELARADVCLHASIRPEPFGQVVLEAMAAGRAVVASAAGGPAEFVRDGHDGLLTPPGDVDALADALLRLAGEPALRRRLGDAARRSAARFDLPLVVGQFEQVVLSHAR